MAVSRFSARDARRPPSVRGALVLLVFIRLALSISSQEKWLFSGVSAFLSGS
jgi:hypothetical protein